MPGPLPLRGRAHERERGHGQAPAWLGAVLGWPRPTGRFLSRQGRRADMSIDFGQSTGINFSLSDNQKKVQLAARDFTEKRSRASRAGRGPGTGPAEGLPDDPNRPTWRPT